MNTENRRLNEERETDLGRGPLAGDGEPDDVATFDTARHCVHLPAVMSTVSRLGGLFRDCDFRPGVEFLEEFLSHGTVSLQSEHDHAEVATGGDLKPAV